MTPSVIGPRTGLCGGGTEGGFGVGLGGFGVSAIFLFEVEGYEDHEEKNADEEACSAKCV